MKTTILTILILAFCSSCSERTEYYIQEEIQPFVSSFYKQAELRGYSLPQNNLKMYLEPGLQERCKCFAHTTWKEGGFGTDPQVTTEIDFDYFYRADSSAISFTVFHEMGHAILRRKAHSNTVSIMNPAIRDYTITPTILDELYQNNEL